MSDQIFLIDQSNALVEMREARYDSEAILQTMLEDYPSLLAGSQIDREHPRRWLLIAREIARRGGRRVARRKVVAGSSLCRSGWHSHAR